MHKTLIALFAACLLGSSFAGRACAQHPGKSFESGELIVGYKSQGDRERAIQALNATKDMLTIRGRKVGNVQIQPVGLAAVKLRIALPEELREDANSDPALELQMLQELAAQIRNDDNRVKYAHPNWTLNGQSS